VSAKKLAIVGHGKMGRMIEQLAPHYGLEVALTLDVHNNARGEGLTRENFQGIDVAVEFSVPEAAPANCERLAALGVNAVVGTTGWFDKLPLVKAAVERAGTALVWSPNFSIGVNVFQKWWRKPAV
jgi:4-hydroxy-tetrahydrodipicolinate reductase